MDILDVYAKLELITALDDGEARNAEPYLWTVFFKIDGSNCRVDSSFHLTGHATVIGHDGASHGNLPSAHSGDVIAIPSNLGEFRTRLFPISFDQPIGGISEASATCGIAVVLMDQDGTSEHDVNVGRQVLATALQQQLDALILTLNSAHREAAPKQIQDISDNVENAVNDAIANEVSIGEWLAAFGDMDDVIGTAFFRFTHDDITPSSSGAFSVAFERTWDNEGLWKISGHLTSQRPTAVTIFADANYAGSSQRLAAGRYNFDQLTIGNDRLSSILIPPGWTVMLFAEAGFGGDALVLGRDTPQVANVLNDRTSSIIVEGPFVTIYRDRGFQGPSQILRPGSFDVTQIALGNDRLSSIRVPPGFSVTLFAEAGFFGDKLVLTADKSYVGALLDDRTSSIVVESMLHSPIDPHPPKKGLVGAIA